MAKLSAAEVQKSIADFTGEARACAERGNGFAAMSTIFNVILSVSETVFGSDSNIRLFEQFVPEMAGGSVWLAVAGEAPSNAEIAKLLTDIRNGFAHACSMPPNAMMHNTIKEAANVARLTAMTSPTQTFFFVGVADFVDAVEAAVDKLSKAHPNSEFDPSGGKDRGPAQGFSLH